MRGFDLAFDTKSQEMAKALRGAERVSALLTEDTSHRTRCS